MRYLGGSSNHWGGCCRPLDTIDFEERELASPFGLAVRTRSARTLLSPAPRSLVEAARSSTTIRRKWTAALGAPLPLDDGGVYTTYFQFSKQRDSILPTHFGERYSDDLKRSPI